MFCPSGALISSIATNTITTQPSQRPVAVPGGTTPYLFISLLPLYILPTPYPWRRRSGARERGLGSGGTYIRPALFLCGERKAEGGRLAGLEEGSSNVFGSTLRRISRLRYQCILNTNNSLIQNIFLCRKLCGLVKWKTKHLSSTGVL